MILGGILLHLGIRPVINIPGFGEAMIATYLTFLAPDELQALLRWLDPRAALARFGSLLSPANLWPPGRQVSIPALQNSSSRARVPRPSPVPSRWPSGKAGQVTWMTWAVFLVVPINCESELTQFVRRPGLLFFNVSAYFRILHR